MLIKALCDYYDILARAGNVLPDGYSDVAVHCLVALNPDGKIDEIIDYRDKEILDAGKGKTRERFVPRHVMLPKRTEKPGIDFNIIEHRPLYLFGLNYDKKTGVFTPEDEHGKAAKSFAVMKRANLEFTEGMDSPTVLAYRAFLQNWKPEEETSNPGLLGISKIYQNAGYIFCLSGRPDLLLEKDPQIREKWEGVYKEKGKNQSDQIIAQCAVTGEQEPIARIHGKIKGIIGGNPTGMVLVNFNNPSECSYGNEQSYNSNISEYAMEKYTEALNYLLRDKAHKTSLDDVTVIYWAMSEKKEYCDLFSMLMFDEKNTMDAGQTEKMLSLLFRDAAEGIISPDRIGSMENIDPSVDFYMTGLKPNSSRLSVKFLYRKKYGEILCNIALYQKDIQITESLRPIPFWRLKRELISPNSTNETISPALEAKLLESVFYGTMYPFALLQTVVRRVKTDADRPVNEIRAGIIKAFINRDSRIKNQKEDLKLALDLENRTQSYLCGRLFAVLERLQQDASGGNLNRTIKDVYFSSAMSKPAIVFPKLIKLARNHMSKVKSPVYYNKLIGEIIDHLDGMFPDSLLLPDQGEFIVGYYQQTQSFFVKKTEAVNENKTEAVNENKTEAADENKSKAADRNK